MRKKHWIHTALLAAGLVLSLCACGYTEQERTITPEMQKELSVWQTQGATDLEPNFLIASSKEVNGLRYDLVMNQGCKIDGRDAEPYYAIWDCENFIGYCELRAYQNDALVGQYYIPELMFFYSNDEWNEFSIPFTLNVADYNIDGTPDFALCQSYTDSYAITDVYCYDGKGSFRNLLGTADEHSTAGWLLSPFLSFSPEWLQDEHGALTFSIPTVLSDVHKHALLDPVSGQYESLLNEQGEPVPFLNRADVAAMPNPIADPFDEMTVYHFTEEDRLPIPYPELKPLQPLTSDEDQFCRTAANNLFASLDDLMDEHGQIDKNDFLYSWRCEEAFLIATDLDENHLPEIFCFWPAGGNQACMRSAVYTFDEKGNCLELSDSLGAMSNSRLYHNFYRPDDDFEIERNGSSLVAHIINEEYINNVWRRTPAYQEFFITYDGMQLTDHCLEWQRNLTYPFHAEWVGFGKDPIGEETSYVGLSRQEYLKKRDLWKGEYAEKRDDNENPEYVIKERVYMQQLPAVDLHALCLRTMRQFYSALNAH